MQPHRLEHREHALAGHVGGQGGVLPRVRDERDGAEVVDLVGVAVAQRPDQAGHVGEVAGVQDDVGEQRPDEVELRVVLATDQAVDVVALGEQELGEIEAVLAGDPGDEGRRHAGHVRAATVEVGVALAG